MIEKTRGSDRTDNRSALKKMAPRRCGGIDKFLLKELEKGEVQGLTWLNKAQGIFHIPWVHGSIKNFHFLEHRVLEIRYEDLRGMQPSTYSDAKLTTMKQRFSMALGNSKTIKRIPNKVAPAKSGKPPFRIYRFVNWQLVYDAPNYERKKSEPWMTAAVRDARTVRRKAERVAKISGSDDDRKNHILKIPCDTGIENNTENVLDVGDKFIQDFLLSISPENNEELRVANEREVGDVKKNTEQRMGERFVNGINDINITQDMWAEFIDTASRSVSCTQVDAGCTANEVSTADVGAHNAQIMQSAPCAEKMLHEHFLPVEQIHVPITDQVKETDNVPNWNELGMSSIEDMEMMEMEDDQAATQYEASPLDPGRDLSSHAFPPDMTNQVPLPELMLPPSLLMEYVKMDWQLCMPPFEEDLNDDEM